MSFFDHFTGGALDARWQSAIAASGAVNVTDSCVELVSPANADAAILWANTPVDLSRSQLWLICVSNSNIAVSSSFNIFFAQKASAPAISSAGTAIFAANLINTSNLTLRYVDSGSANQRWDGATDTWSTGSPDAMGPIVAGDFFIVGFEIDREDGANRFRMFCASHPSTGALTVEQGMRIFALTDWVDFSAALAITNPVWFVAGDSSTAAQNGTTKIEWIRCSDGARIYAWTNAKEASASGVYGIREQWSYDNGQFFVPADRETIAVASAKDPCVIRNGANFDMYVRAETGNANGSAGDLLRYDASSVHGPWTYRNKPVAQTATLKNFFPFVVHAPWETAGFKWQLVTSRLDNTIPQTDLRLLTADGDDPASTWTDRGLVKAIGLGAVVLHRNGQYELWYSNTDAGVGTVTGLRLTGASLLTLLSDGVGFRLGHQDANQLLSADLTTNVASMTDTEGFEADAAVYFQNSTDTPTDDEWNESRIRKVTANTSIELYHRVLGFTTALGAKAWTVKAGRFQIRAISRVGDEWYVHTTSFNFPTWSSDSVFQEETSLLIVPAGFDLDQMNTSMLALIHSPTVYRGSWSNIGSTENISLLHGELEQAVSGGSTARRLRGFPHMTTFHQSGVKIY